MRVAVAGRSGLSIGMTEKLTILALCDLGLITDAEVEAAIAAYMADPMAVPYVFEAGYRLNLGKAIRRHPGANDFVLRSDAGPQLKRPFVRAAILQARPERE
ncbi:hypothetical protein PMNALOAF_1885 [Methylobacterium adhaesivum]|uniref:Uncharacterized protein n=1 Tax=Methylobacterium adhaesivum TaxID=333297 RepID=A0ABT8BEC0_9HYPH|nr:hypothetical protein [Methylobacterium adhaesivum]MDN3589620.1 hypothetical protein [Methylobacterium adhaesivum]GJD30637.1 hypothetical protein PMNALOAF_1885 [Methylobacterium adhaesivum]